jgi:uncharacterized membrane protein
MRRLLFALGLSAWVAAPGGAAAQAVSAQQVVAALQGNAALAAGTVLEHAVRIGTRQVPLPEGRWTVAGDASYVRDDMRVGAFGRMRNLILFRLVPGASGAVIDAMAEINTNLLPTTDGWGIAADCARSDLIVAVVRYKSGWDGSCLFITHTLAGESVVADDPPAAWAAAAEFARRERLALPRLWLTAGFRATNRADIVDLRLHFAPHTRGIPAETPRRWKDSAWMAETLPNDAPRLALARALGEWAAPFSGLVESGLKGRLGAQETMPMPSLVATSGAGNAVLAQREALLEALRRDGALNEAQFAEQLQRLHDRGLETGTTVPDPSTVALYKTLAYRPIVSFINFWIDLYWIGTPFAAGVLEVLQIVVNSYKFYAHEVAWSRIAAGGSHPDVARILDFRYLARSG